MYCLNFQHFKTNINAHVFNCRINNMLTFNIFFNTNANDTFSILKIKYSEVQHLFKV